MSYTSVRIEPRDEIEARESRNYGEDRPIDDDTELVFDLDARNDGPLLCMSIGKFREFVAAGEAAIAAIPAQREEAAQRDAYWASVFERRNAEAQAASVQAAAL